MVIKCLYAWSFNILPKVITNQDKGYKKVDFIIERLVVQVSIKIKMASDGVLASTHSLVLVSLHFCRLYSC